jgi:hypothetical protein
MQYAPRAFAESSFAQPDAGKPAPASVVSVQVTVKNIGGPALRIRSGESLLELADGRRLVVHRIPQPQEATTARTEPPREELPPSMEVVAVQGAIDAEEPTAPTPAGEIAKTVVVVGLGIGAAIVELTPLVYPPIIVFMTAAAIATSPIWGTMMIISKHTEQAQRQRSRDGRLERGDVVLATGESASAVVHFTSDGVDPARLGTAFLILPVTDEGVDRHWTARIPVAIPK